MADKLKLAIEIIRNSGGIIRTSEATIKGIHSRTLYALRDNGIIEAVSRGLYQLVDRAPVADPDLETVSLKVPRATICLISALSFHNLTTQIPHSVSIALVKGAETPRIDYPPLTVYRMSERSLCSGVEEHQMGAAIVKVFSREKTIADCFKFRNKIGLDIVLEALKFYMTRGDKNIPKLLEYASICRVTKIVTPYLESFL